MNKTKVIKAFNELLKEDESLKYALATNLAKYGRPQSKKSDKPDDLTKGLEKGREKYVKDLKKAGLDEAAPVSVGLNMDQTDAVYKVLEDNFGEEHMKDMFTLGSLSFYNMMVKGGIAGVFNEETINEESYSVIDEVIDKDDLKTAKELLKYPHTIEDIEYRKTSRGDKFVKIIYKKKYVPGKMMDTGPHFVSVFYSDEKDLPNIGKALKLKLKESVEEAAKRDYKKEYAKYGKSEKSKKYRAELNKYNRDKGTYGNGDNKDASHKGGKIVGFESESKNRGRAEKSRLKKSK